MTLESIRAALRGGMIVPGDAEWDAARTSSAVRGEPLAVISPVDAADVAAVLPVIAAAGLEVAVRSGGHSHWEEQPGAVVIDLRELASVEVLGPHPSLGDHRSLVRVGPGARWGEVAAQLAGHGLGISSGDTASVGVGGLTLGGGIGHMVRAWGLACDQLVGAELVTVDGRVLEVDDETHPDLMWGLRGAGWMLGVVTRLDFAAHPLPGVVVGEFTVAGDRTPVLAALDAVMAVAPRALTVTFLDAPPMDPIVPPGATITAVWAGVDETAAAAAIAPISAIDGVELVSSGVSAYPDVLIQAPPFDPAAPPPGFIGGNALVASLPAEFLDRATGFRAEHDASLLFLRSLGGAYGDVPDDATAFAFRSARWCVMGGAFELPDVTAEQRERIAGEWAAIEAHGLGMYGNFTTSTAPEVAERAYVGGTRDRLAALRREVDPAGVLTRGHMVAPA